MVTETLHFVTQHRFLFHEVVLKKKIEIPPRRIGTALHIFINKKWLT